MEVLEQVGACWRGNREAAEASASATQARGGGWPRGAGGLEGSSGSSHETNRPQWEFHLVTRVVRLGIRAGSLVLCRGDETLLPLSPL